MNITTQGYNVPKVSFGTSITPSTSTIIGTKDEFQQLYNMCEASGVAIVDAIISGNRMQGAMFGHCDGIGIELATLPISIIHLNLFQLMLNLMMMRNALLQLQ